MTTQQFFDKYNNKGIDFDNYYGFQCMDLAHQYAVEVNGQDIPSAPAAKDVWDKATPGYDKIKNTPTNVPQQGDIIIWGTAIGAYGHIAVFDHGDQNTFTSFDQNWPLNSVCHFQQHNYSGILGWLRPKSETPEPMPTSPQTPPETAPITDSTRIHIGVNPETSHDYGDPQVFELRNIIFGYEHQVNDLASQLKVQQLISQGNLDSLNKSRADNEKLTSQLVDAQNKLTQVAATTTISPSGQTSNKTANSPSTKSTWWDFLGQILGNVKKPKAS